MNQLQQTLHHCSYSCQVICSVFCIYLCNVLFMPVRSIRIPDDVEAKILEVQTNEPEKSINSIMVDAIRVGLDCPEEAELSDRVKTLEQKVSDIEKRLDAD